MTGVTAACFMCGGGGRVSGHDRCDWSEERQECDERAAAAPKNAATRSLAAPRMG